MIEGREKSEREHQRSERQRAMSVRYFCEAYNMGKTRTYEEIKSGRLRVRKIGRRTLIGVDDAEEWFNRLNGLRANRGH